MVFSRRKFLQNSTLLAAGTIIPLRKLDLGRGRGTDQGGSGDPGTSPVKPAPIAPLPASGPVHNANLLNMTRQSFAPYVNSGFSMQTGQQTVGLTLLSVTELETPAAPANLAGFAVMPPASYMTPVVTDAFALQFRGPANIPQGTYAFRHSALGDFSLLIVPGNGQTYTGIINHLQAGIITAPGLPGTGGRQGVAGDAGPRRGRGNR